MRSVLSAENNDTNKSKKRSGSVATESVGARTVDTSANEPAPFLDDEEYELSEADWNDISSQLDGLSVAELAEHLTPEELRHFHSALGRGDATGLGLEVAQAEWQPWWLQCRELLIQECDIDNAKDNITNEDSYSKDTKNSVYPVPPECKEIPPLNRLVSQERLQLARSHSQWSSISVALLSYAAAARLVVGEWMDAEGKKEFSGYFSMLFEDSTGASKNSDVNNLKEIIIRIVTHVLPGRLGTLLPHPRFPMTVLTDLSSLFLHPSRILSALGHAHSIVLSSDKTKSSKPSVALARRLAFLIAWVRDREVVLKTDLKILRSAVASVHQGLHE